MATVLETKTVLQPDDGLRYKLASLSGGDGTFPSLRVRLTWQDVHVAVLGNIARLPGVFHVVPHEYLWDALKTEKKSFHKKKSSEQR